MVSRIIVDRLSEKITEIEHELDGLKQISTNLKFQD